MNIRKLPLAALVTGLLGYSGVLLAGSYAPASPIVLPDDIALSPAVAIFRSFGSQVEFEELKESEPVDSAPRNSVKVDDDGAQCPDAAFTTIQGAVDAGANFIEICAGLYPENVVIGTGLRTKLLGHGTGSTTVTGVAGTAGPIIDVSGGGQTNIEGLTVDGGSAMAGGVVTGIRYDASDGKIKDVEVLNIRDASGSSQGIGIRVQSTEGVPTRIKVVKTLVQNYSRGGIDGNGMGVHLAVNRSDIVGPVAPVVWAPNGIQVSRGAMGRIADNVVDNNPSPDVPGGAGSGIILFCAGASLVKDNTVTRADLGISIVDNALARVERNDVSDSDFDAISLQFLGLFFGDIGCSAPGIPLPVENNDIYRNTLNNSDDGVTLENFDLASLVMTPNNNNICRNDITNSFTDGIHVWEGADNVFDNNEIASSGGTDAVDGTLGLGTAGTANTWQRNDCTTSSPAGLCD